MEDLSGRGLERYPGDSNAAKWFYDFDLTEATPDHTVFSRLRTKIGTYTYLRSPFERVFVQDNKRLLL